MAIPVKICGLTDETSIHAVNAAKADFAGFVYFAASPRHIPLLKAAALKSLLAPRIQAVSVLVDPTDTLLDEVNATLSPSFIQLHGKESPERIAAIKNRFAHIKIIKALPVRNSDDVARAMHFQSVADMFLFDAKVPESSSLPGGNGLSFDWALLKGREFPLPWLLSGGLNEANVAEAIRISGARMVDVSSGVESAPGVKDPTLIEAFIKAARTA